jgi:nucleotide-binding universal stress UspA family protein
VEEAPAVIGSIGAQPIRRIAHPINFAKFSKKGLSWAIHFAKEYDADLLLLHVVPPPTPLFEAESPIKSESELALSLLLGKLKIAEIKARGFLLTGKATTDAQIVRAAKLERVDLIIMETHGHAVLSWLFGRSLASRVIARAHCHVLVVPSDATTEVIVRSVAKRYQDVS